MVARDGVHGFPLFEGFRVRSNRVQVHDLAGMPCIAQAFGKALPDCVTKRPRVMVCVNRQDSHGGSAPPEPLAQSAASQPDFAMVYRWGAASVDLDQSRVAQSARLRGWLKSTP